jgi:hypothetical protein
VTSVIGFESPLLAVLACLGFSRKNQRSAFSDFCNTIPPKADIETGPVSASTQQLRQLGDIRRDPPRLILTEQLGCRSSPRLVLEINIGELLSVVIADDKTGGLFLDRPRRRKAAGLLAVLFNPLIPIYLSRGTWFYFDLLAAALFAAHLLFVRIMTIRTKNSVEEQWKLPP